MQMTGTPEGRYERLLQSAMDRRLLLLSPGLRHTKVASARFIGIGEDSYLYTLTPHDADLHSFLSALDRNLHEVVPKPGHELQSVVARSQPSLQSLAEALVLDLARIRPALRFLVLDAFDYIQLTEDLQRFLYHLVNCLPDSLSIVISTRVLPHQFWSAFVRTGQAIVLSDSTTADFFTPSQLDKPHLEVYAFSGGQVFRDGLPITEWDGPLPRNLFFYLVDHPTVTRDEIFATFWPDLTIKEATNVFHVTKRKITERLGCELTEYRGGFYHHNGEISLLYDVETFERAVRDAEQASPERATDLWKKAVMQYRMSFLHPFDTPWISRRREHLQSTYANTLVQLARWYRHQAETDLAISFFLRAQRELPEREDLCRDLMELYQLRGETSRATEQYRVLCDRLWTRLRIKPSKTTEQLYNRVAQTLA